MDALEQRIAHRCARDKFPKGGSPIEQKLRSHREAIRVVDLEIEAIGNRVAKLEADRERPH